MSLNKHLFATAALSALALFALAACTAGTEASATPAGPTPTATPVPIESIAIDPEADPEGFLAALPSTEVQCAASAVGSAEVLVKLIADPDDISLEVSDTQLQVMAACFSDQTIKSILVGQLELQAGGLTDETRTCIAEHAADVDLSLFFSEGTEATADAGAFVSLAQSLFCLNAEERAALETSAGGLIDAGDLDIDAIECVADSVGIESFTNIATMFAGSSEPEVDLSVIGNLLPAMIECGVMTDEDMQDTGMTTEQMSCLFSKLDPEVLASMMTIAETPGATPDFSGLAAALAVLEECGVDLQAMMDASTGASFNGSIPGLNTAGVPSVSVDAVTCLTDHGVSLDVAAAYAAGIGDASDATLAAAIEACEGELDDVVATAVPSLIDMLPVTAEEAQCLLANVSTEQMEGIAQGTVSPLTILTALETCGISLEELLEVVS